MSVISVTITASSVQIVSGIPEYVSLSSNIPCSIFYTLDCSTPTTSSNIYIGPIYLSEKKPPITINILATDGVDSSPIISQTYVVTGFVGDRVPHATVKHLDQQEENRLNIFPFGDTFQGVNVEYGAVGGITVDDNDGHGILDGYDGQGNGTVVAGQTDLPLYDYDMVYSESNSEGLRGYGIGTLPAQVTIRVPPSASAKQPESSNVNSPFFNPKALVIYQDSRDTPLDPNAPIINRQFFSLENPETTKTGALLFNTGLDGMQPTGSFVRSVFNPSDQTITYYYFDSSTLRWIISKEPYTPKNSNIGNYSQITLSPRRQGNGMVFNWMPFKGSRLI
jgi:hypothetical protein